MVALLPGRFRRHVKLLWLVTLLAAGCHAVAAGHADTDLAAEDPDALAVDVAPQPDAVAPTADAAPDASPDAALDVAPDVAIDPVAQAACEAALDAEWQAHPPSTGIATAASAKSYDAIIGKFMADFAIPGGAVAVVKNGKLVFAKGYGLADIEAQQPAHPDALFRIASLSKQLTAFAILTLVEVGKLGLDDQAFAILGDLQPAPGATLNPQLAAITIRNLLNHTGGWNRDSTFDPMFDPFAIASALGVPAPPSCSDIVRYMLGKPLQYTPGTTYEYSNFGYCVLGRIIEKKTGMPYADYVQSAVLGKAGVHDAAIGRSLLADRADHEVRYYDYAQAPLAKNVFDASGPKVPWPYGGFDIEAMDSHGAWILSPIDLLRVQTVADNRPDPGDILTAASFAELMANPKVASGNKDGTATPWTDSGYWYGFGLQLNKFGNWWHTGSLPGTATEVVRAQNGYGWAAFFNTRPNDQSTFWNRLDQDLWTALDGAQSDFVSGDLFATYDDFTDWLGEAAFDAKTTAQVAVGWFPVHIEGRLTAGTVQLRARFGAKPAVAAVDFATRLTCTQLRAKDQALSGFAHASLQWFADAAGRRRYQASWVKP